MIKQSTVPAPDRESKHNVSCKSICETFKITDDEYRALEKEFGKLTKYETWQLLKKNARNNHTNDFEDVQQELLWSLVRAGSYYKRQVYIESCFEAAKRYAKDDFVGYLLKELESLWDNRTRHGANRQKFGEHQERLLERLVKKLVPLRERPSKDRPLTIDSKFKIYCKAITWNTQKSMGRKITKEKVIRSGQVSLSDYDYLATAGNGV